MNLAPTEQKPHKQFFLLEC